MSIINYRKRSAITPAASRESVDVQSRKKPALTGAERMRLLRDKQSQEKKDQVKEKEPALTGAEENDNKSVRGPKPLRSS